MGHGIQLVSAYSGTIFALAAILYVDDSDLIHLAKTPDLSDSDFFNDVQRATMDWGGLVQATGGSLKPAKCFWYMMAWKWRKGVPTLKANSELPQTPLHIPQPGEAPSVPIPLKPIGSAEKKLGVFTSPSGNFECQLEHITKTGIEWASNMQSSSCPARDAWLGLRYQLFPKISYGLVAVSAPPKQLEKVFQTIYYKALPSLRVNRNITKAFHTLPYKFQGLGLLDPNIEIFALKL
jgi:hypothetical protein